MRPKLEQVAGMMASGFSRKQIADAFDISESTASVYEQQVFAHIGAVSRRELIKTYKQSHPPPYTKMLEIIKGLQPVERICAARLAAGMPYKEAVRGTVYDVASYKTRISKLLLKLHQPSVYAFMAACRAARDAGQDPFAGVKL